MISGRNVEGSLELDCLTFVTEIVFTRGAHNYSFFCSSLFLLQRSEEWRREENIPNKEKKIAFLYIISKRLKINNLYNEISLFKIKIIA